MLGKGKRIFDKGRGGVIVSSPTDGSLREHADKNVQLETQLPGKYSREVCEISKNAF